MTITSTPSEIAYAGNGVTTSFAINFVFDTSADLKVYSTVIATGVITQVTSGFTVTGGNGLTGDIAFSVAPAATVSIAILDDPALTQPADYISNDAFPAETHERALDRVTRIAKRLYQTVQKTIRVADGDAASGDDLLLPTLANRASKFLAFDANGNPIASAAVSDGDALLRAELIAGASSLVKSTAVKYDITPAEDAALVTSVNLYIPNHLIDGVVHVSRYGSDHAALLNAIKVLEQGGNILDLDNLQIPVYVGVSGVTSGDCVVLSQVPRLASLTKDVMVRNGRVYADSPSASGTLYRFPSTFAVDGCTGKVKFSNVKFVAKGESWGDSDASSGLGYEARRDFLQQNGGHALVIIRSKNVETDNTCRFERAGSVGAVYVTSSELVTGNETYSTCESLGYAAFCADSWCGPIATSGFARHELVLNNCRSDNNGTAYGSKGCVVAEDIDVICRVNGGVWKDAYANGSAHHLGYAFSAAVCTMIVNGGQVENCASIGMTTHSTAADTFLTVNGVTARGLRTSMHIAGNNSIGSSYVKYIDCVADIVGGSTWAEPELSVSSVISNQKAGSTLNIDLVNCVTTGAHTFAINVTSICYGGVRVIGGIHTLSDRLFDSTGWGGSSAGTGRGYELLGGAKFVFTDSTPSTAVVAATTARCVIKNSDANPAYVYQYIHFDRSVTVEDVLNAGSMQLFNYRAVSSGALLERRIMSQRLSNAYQDESAGEPFAQSVTIDTLVGISGSNYQAVLTLSGNRPPAGGFIVDDTFANRSLISTYSGPTVSAGKLQYGYYLDGTTANVTAAASYPMQSFG